MTKKEKQVLIKQFKQLLEILIVNDPTCEIHTDFYCDKTYDDECCAIPSKCPECKYKHKIKSDIIFDNTAEDTRLFYVIGKKDRRKYVTSLYTYEDILSELAYINQECIGTMDKENLKYYEKVEELNCYAQNFFNQVVNECFPTINKNILPIKFHRFLQSWKDYTAEKCSLGNYHKYVNQNIINIFAVGDIEINKLKQNINHEILHYCLDQCNLKYDDADGIFWALSDIYDAGAYQPMNETEQKIYDNFIMLYNNWDNVKDYYITKKLDKNLYVQAFIMIAGSKDPMVQEAFVNQDTDKLKVASGM